MKLVLRCRNAKTDKFYWHMIFTISFFFNVQISRVYNYVLNTGIVEIVK